MYKINHAIDSNILEVKTLDNQVYAKIHLNDGASLQVLTLGGHEIIQDLNPLDYKTTYASSILFPFANRIKDGAYSYKGEKFQLEINQKEENNALHGFIYNKKFEVIDTKTNDDYAAIKLEYTEKNKHKGFPYTFSVQLTYTLSKSKLGLNVLIKNTCDNAFPFTIGWHPYFSSADLYHSALQFSSDQKLIIGERNITSGKEAFQLEDLFKIQDKQLDDCWILKTGLIDFFTPKYQLELRSSSTNNFMQVYTPPKSNTVAIEPTTGVSNSFNNNLGLQILNPKETYEIHWGLTIKKLKSLNP